MKKSSFYLSALALVLAGCSSEAPVVNNSDQQENPSTFITIRMMSAPDVYMGRADNGVYENGSADENNVQRVRFYFFDGAGDPFGVHRNTASQTYDSFIDWYPTASDVVSQGQEGSDQSVVPGQTVEKVLTATLGINLAGSEKPAEVLAIINPTDAVLGLSNSGNAENVNGPSLTAIRGVVTDYLSNMNPKAFVMSNSVYMDNNEIVYTTALSEANFAQTPEAAKQNSVKIYVERVLARIDLGLDPDFIKGAIDADGGKIYLADTIQVNDSTAVEGGQTYTDAEIYVKLLGWNVTRTTSQSRLVKEIDKTWTVDDIFGGLPWNASDFYRSFWAINPASTTPGFGFRYGTFGTEADPDNQNFNPAQALQFPTEAGKYTVTYMQENAAPFEEPGAYQPNSSQVIVAAQLVDKTGKPLTLTEWGYKKYTLTGLKNQLAKVLSNLYSVTEETGADDVKQKVYTPISPDQLTFQYEDPYEDSTDKNYWVYAVLTEDAANLKWQVGSGSNGTALENAIAVNLYIRDMVNHVMIWNGGLTYYYFNIRHLGQETTDAGYFGVVRNHIYRSTISSISGLGVPVYDPDQIIIPETSAPDDFIISADLRILQWRVVSNSYDLKWE